MFPKACCRVLNYKLTRSITHELLPRPPKGRKEAEWASKRADKPGPQALPFYTSLSPGKKTWASPMTLVMSSSWQQLASLSNSISRHHRMGGQEKGSDKSIGTCCSSAFSAFFCTILFASLKPYTQFSYLCRYRRNQPNLQRQGVAPAMEGPPWHLCQLNCCWSGKCIMCPSLIS